MDDAISYSLIGIIILIVVIIVTLRTGDDNKEIKTKKQKKAEIIAQYKLELQKALKPLKDNQDDRVAKKTEMLKKFSNELSRNIFFDKDEIRNIILELTNND